MERKVGHFVVLESPAIRSYSCCQRFFKPTLPTNTTAIGAIFEGTERFLWFISWFWDDGTIFQFISWFWDDGTIFMVHFVVLGRWDVLIQRYIESIIENKRPFTSHRPLTSHLYIESIIEQKRPFTSHRHFITSHFSVTKKSFPQPTRPDSSGYTEMQQGLIKRWLSV